MAGLSNGVKCFHFISFQVLSNLMDVFLGYDFHEIFWEEKVSFFSVISSLAMPSLFSISFSRQA